MECAGVSKGKKTPCAYCGRPSEGGRDHVPGKQFFPSPRPKDLVTVPSCDSCNGEFKPDEDLFRSTFWFGPGGQTPAARALWKQKIDRAHDKDLGLRKAVAQALAVRSVVTPAGLHLGNHMTISIDWPRTLHFIEKCVRGLYYFEVGGVLGEDVEVQSLGIVPVTAHVMGSVEASLKDGTRAWPGVFQYKYAVVTEAPKMSAWKFMFLDTYVFGSLTGDGSEEAATV